MTRNAFRCLCYEHSNAILFYLCRDDDDVDWNEDDEYYEGDEEYVSALQLKVAAASRSKNQFSNFQSISKSTRGGSPTSEIP